MRTRGGGKMLTGSKSSLRIPLLGEAFFTSAIKPGSPVLWWADLRAPTKSLGGGTLSRAFFRVYRGLFSFICQCVPPFESEQLNAEQNKNKRRWKKERSDLRNFFILVPNDLFQDVARRVSLVLEPELKRSNVVQWRSGGWSSPYLYTLTINYFILVHIHFWLIDLETLQCRRNTIRTFRDSRLTENKNMLSSQYNL